MDRYDKERIYCRKLGHWITFEYCRQENNGLPCHKIMDCWFEKLPIEEFLKENYTDEDISYIFKPSKQKITSLIELIEQAKKRTN
ncbi:MAG: hypothetical protein P8Y62_01290 [candidate division WOR-3 bacterium]|jgi:hypothetical protein